MRVRTGVGRSIVSEHGACKVAKWGCSFISLSFLVRVQVLENLEDVVFVYGTFKAKMVAGRKRPGGLALPAAGATDRVWSLYD